MSKHQESIDTLRSSDRKVRAVLARLEHEPPPCLGDRRAARRYPYLVGESLDLQIEGEPTRFVVRGRDISAIGISFLHGTFLYSGQRCTVTLRTIDGERVLVSGQVVNCRSAQDRIHVVGLAFDDPIDIVNFVHLPEKPQAGRENAAEPGPEPDYPAGQVVELARRLQGLAIGKMPLADLQQTVATLLPLLHIDLPRDAQPPSNPPPPDQADQSARL